MGVKVETSYCHTCGQQRMFQREGINHVLHLFLTVFTLGAWSIVWLVLAVVRHNKRPRCTSCGMPTTLVFVPGQGVVETTAPAQEQRPTPPPEP